MNKQRRHREYAEEPCDTHGARPPFFCFSFMHFTLRSKVSRLLSDTFFSRYFANLIENPAGFRFVLLHRFGE